jgi:hypothetical protein
MCRAQAIRGMVEHGTEASVAVAENAFLPRSVTPQGFSISDEAKALPKGSLQPVREIGEAITHSLA